MTNCSKCNQLIEDGNEKVLFTRIVCEDCFIDEMMPKMRKSHYEDDAEFMQRLLDSHPVRKPKYH
jgi:hypothetical protein